MLFLFEHYIRHFFLSFYIQGKLKMIKKRKYVKKVSNCDFIFIKHILFDPATVIWTEVVAVSHTTHPTTPTHPQTFRAAGSLKQTHLVNPFLDDKKENQR